MRNDFNLIPAFKWMQFAVSDCNLAVFYIWLQLLSLDIGKHGTITYFPGLVWSQLVSCSIALLWVVRKHMAAAVRVFHAEYCQGGLFRVQPDLRIQVAFRKQSKWFWDNFECDFSPFRTRTLAWSHPWYCDVLIGWSYWVIGSRNPLSPRECSPKAPHTCLLQGDLQRDGDVTNKTTTKMELFKVMKKFVYRKQSDWLCSTAQSGCQIVAPQVQILFSCP